MKLSCLTVLALLLVSGSYAKAADRQSTSTDWYVYVDGQTKYASEHVVKRTLESGDLEYRIQSRILLDFLGNRQEEVTNAIYVEKPDLTPVSLRVNTKRASGEVEIVGDSNVEHFKIRRTSNGLSRSSTIAFSQRPIFRALLPEAIVRLGTNPKVTETELAVIDEESLQIEPAKCKKRISEDPSAMVWSIEIGSDVVLSKGQVTFRNGVREREVSSMPKYSLERSSEHEASQIAHLSIDGRNVLMFDVDKQISRIDLLKDLTVRLRWKDVSLDQLHLSDGRQELVSHKHEGSQHEAVVRISSHVEPPPRTRVKLENEDRVRLLSSSQYIDPIDTAVVSTASDWTKDCRTPEEVIDALTRKVFEHLQGSEAIAETLSAPEVLRCKKGKCTEYAILFASLARAKKLPTRIVLGERMINGQWIGHMWNEVFLEDLGAAFDPERQTGRWVTVDATTKEVGLAPALLKLTHSSTVEGTQPIRWALTDSLEFSVMSFALKEDGPSDKWETGVKDNTYTSAEFGFRVSSPNKDWQMIPTLKAGTLEMRFSVAGDDRVLVHCAAASLPVPFEAKALMAIRSAKSMTIYKEYSVVSNEAESVNERDWQKLHFTRALGPKESIKFSESKTMKATEYLFCEGNVLFLVNLIAGDAVHDKHINELQEIVNSFVFK